MVKGLGRQIRISLTIIGCAVLFYFAYITYQSQRAVMVGGSEFLDQQSKIDELTWEVLVVDVQLRSKLWARYEGASLEERENAFKAIINMMDSISPDQAKHLVKELLERSGETKNRSHFQNLLRVLERLGLKFNNTMPVVAHYAAKTLSKNSGSPRQIDVRNMIENIESESKDTAYKYCLEGSEKQIRECAERLVAEKSAKSQKPLDDYLSQKNNDISKVSEILVAMAQGKVEKGKGFIPKYLSSRNPVEVALALRLIREYNLTSYLPQIRKMREGSFETVRNEIDSTISYLSIADSK